MGTVWLGFWSCNFPHVGSYSHVDWGISKSIVNVLQKAKGPPAVANFIFWNCNCRFLPIRFANITFQWRVPPSSLILSSIIFLNHTAASLKRWQLCMLHFDHSASFLSNLSTPTTLHFCFLPTGEGRKGTKWRCFFPQVCLLQASCL